MHVNFLFYATGSWTSFGSLSTCPQRADSKGFRGTVGNIHNLANKRKGPVKIIGIERGGYAPSEAPFLSLHRQ